MLQVKGLKAASAGTAILKGLDLELQSGTRAAIMGPNGGGKSTFANVLAGNPSYEVTAGSVSWNGADLLAMTPEARASNGLFLAFQYPPSIPGVPVSQFLRLCLGAQETARGEKLTGGTAYIKRLRSAMQALKIKPEFAERGVNDGMSGGEKKRLEMLQLLVLQPTLVILDEIDSGLDIDALRLVAQAIELLDRQKTAVLIITHYQRLLEYVTPDTVHVLIDGRITQSGGPELATDLERTGYAFA